MNLFDQSDEGSFTLSDLNFFSPLRQVRKISNGILSHLDNKEKSLLAGELAVLNDIMHNQKKSINKEFDKLQQLLYNQLGGFEDLEVKTKLLMEQDLITIEDKSMYIKAITDIKKNKTDITKELVKVTSDKFKNLRDETKSYYDSRKAVLASDPPKKEGDSIIMEGSAMGVFETGMDNKPTITGRVAPSNMVDKIKNNYVTTENVLAIQPPQSAIVTPPPVSESIIPQFKVEEPVINNTPNIEPVFQEDEPSSFNSVFFGDGKAESVIKSRIQAIDSGELLKVSKHPLNMDPGILLNEIVNKNTPHNEMLIVDGQTGKYFMVGIKEDGSLLETYNPKGLKHIGKLAFNSAEKTVKLEDYPNQIPYKVIDNLDDNDYPSFYREQWSRPESLDLYLKSDTIRTIQR